MPTYPRRSFVRLLAATALGAWALSSATPASAELKRLELIAPANPGGGWDQTARVMQTVLQEAGLASGVQVQNIPGAGGTIGLAQFVTTKKRKGDAILVAGQTLQGAIITNQAPVTLDQVTPLARIVGEYEIVVVPVDSPIQTTADLVAKLKEDPGAVSWGGGSVGSTDHILAGLIMKAVGRRPHQAQLHRPLGRRRGVELDPGRPRHRRASAATASSARRSTPASCGRWRCPPRSGCRASTSRP